MAGIAPNIDGKYGYHSYGRGLERSEAVAVGENPRGSRNLEGETVIGRRARANSSTIVPGNNSTENAVRC